MFAHFLGVLLIFVNAGTIRTSKTAMTPTTINNSSKVKALARSRCFSSVKRREQPHAVEVGENDRSSQPARSPLQKNIRAIRDVTTLKTLRTAGATVPALHAQQPLRAAKS